MKRLIGLLIVTYNGTKYIQECLDSVFAADLDGIDLRVLVVDNASSDGTSELIQQNFPDVTLHSSQFNLGFAGGNNKAWEICQATVAGVEFVYLLNQDTVVEKSFLQTAISYLDKNIQAGAAQSLILLDPQKELINTAGNRLHYLGIGLTTSYLEPRENAPCSGLVGFPSAAGVLLRGSLFNNQELFPPELFLYHEDADLGIRLHLQGHPPHYCRESIVWHKYEFSTTINSYYYLERNRYWILLVFYRWQSLVFLAPMIALMEFGQWIFALSNGLLSCRLRVVGALFEKKFCNALWRQRRKIQKNRKFGDCMLLRLFVPTVKSPLIKSWLLRRIANPVFALYLALVKRIAFW